MISRGFHPRKRRQLETRALAHGELQKWPLDLVWNLARPHWPDARTVDGLSHLGWEPYHLSASVTSLPPVCVSIDLFTPTKSAWSMQLRRAGSIALEQFQSGIAKPP
jgi:hypothetical protein